MYVCIVNVLCVQDYGASINHETRDGFTALTTAVRESKRTLCQLLLKRGADPHKKCMDGSTSAFDIAQAKVSALSRTELTL